MTRRVAICIAGEMRTWKACLTGLRAHVLEPLQPDVFVFTWRQNSRSHKESGDGRREAETSLREEDVKEALEPRAFLFPDYDSGYSQQLHGVELPWALRGHHYWHARSALPMFYGIKICNQLKSEAEALDGRRYDLVIRIRPDLEFNGNLPDHVLSRDECLWYSSHAVGPDQISDKFALGTSEQMDYYSGLFDQLNTYWEFPVGDGTWRNIRVGERLMRKHMEEAQFPSEPFDMPVRILRFASHASQSAPAAASAPTDDCKFSLVLPVHNAGKELSNYLRDLPTTALLSTPGVV